MVCAELVGESLVFHERRMPCSENVVPQPIIAMNCWRCYRLCYNRQHRLQQEHGPHFAVLRSKALLYFHFPSYYFGLVVVAFFFLTGSIVFDQAVWSICHVLNVNLTEKRFVLDTHKVDDLVNGEGINSTVATIY